MNIATAVTRRGFLKQASHAALLTAGAVGLSGCPILTERITIVGSGITGLCAGAMLAHMGHHVHVLESHPELIGGNAASFVYDGFQFSVGPQYVWSFREEGLGARILRFLGLADTVPFDSMDPDGYDEYRMGDALLARVPMGFERHEETCLELFPDEPVAMRLFFSYLRDFYAATNVIVRAGLYRLGIGAMLSGIFLADDITGRAKARCAQCGDWPLARLFAFCGLSRAAQQFLYGNSGLFLEPATSVWAFAFAGAVGSYHSGADFPRFGFSGLVESLSGVIIDAGGHVETNRRVIELRRSGNRIAEVTCEDGTSIPTDRVISTVSPRLTHGLLGSTPIWRASYTPSPSALCLFVGVRDFAPISEVFAGRNLWWHAFDEPTDFVPGDMTAPPRSLNLTSESARGVHNPNLDTRNHSVAIFAPGNVDQSRQAYDLGPEAYDDFKAAIAEAVVDRVEAHILPGLRRSIQCVDVQTPMEIALRTGAEGANIYGRRLTPQELLTRPYDLWGVPNLHIACATTGLPGIAPAFQTASLLVEELTGFAV